MRNSFKTLCMIFVICFINAVGFTQEVAVASEDAFKVNLTEEVSIFNLTNDTITEVNTSLEFALSEKIQVSLSLPVYSSTNDPSSARELSWQLDNGTFGSTGTGLGDLDVAFTWKNLATILDDVWVDAVGGVKVPIDSTYSSDNFAFFGGVDFGFTRDKVDFSQSLKYYLVDKYTYMPHLGGFVDSNVFAGKTTAMLDVGNKLSVGVVVDEFFSDGQKTVSVGPVVEYAVSSNLNLHAGVGFAVVDDLQYDSLDSVITVGLGFKF